MKGPRRPRFYATVLITGFLLGGFLNAFLRKVLPDSPTKAFFTYTLQGEAGPVPINLLVIHFTLGPVGIDISPSSVVGVLLAYLVAKSLF